MKKIIFLCLSFLIIGCARPKDTHLKVSPHEFTPLSLEESKKLITPTLYYIPIYDQTTLSCVEKKNIKDDNGKLIVTVCGNVFDDCVMQGTCQIKSGLQNILLNIASSVESERRFSIIKNSLCHFGFGSSKTKLKTIKTMCLDPYYSVAADLNIYSLGDVIYIPAVVGRAMPDGSIHDGYFIVRDAGSAIKGYGRFDFFTGFSLNKTENPFAEIGFGDKQTHIPYFVIAGAKSEEILKKRNYPLILVTK